MTNWYQHRTRLVLASTNGNIFVCASEALQGSILRDVLRGGDHISDWFSFHTCLADAAKEENCVTNAQRLRTRDLGRCLVCTQISQGQHSTTRALYADLQAPLVQSLGLEVPAGLGDSSQSRPSDRRHCFRTGRRSMSMCHAWWCSPHRPNHQVILNQLSTL